MEYIHNMESVLLPVLLIIYLVILGVCLAEYLLLSLGLNRMAKNLGLPSPWMAFVPVLSSYLMGLIAETSTDGKKPLRYSLILLLFPIAALAAFVLFFVLGIIVSSGENYFITFAFIETADLFISAINIANTVFSFIALYRIYKLYAPDNATLFIVLSIFVPISMPIIMFILRNKPPQIFLGDPYSQTNFDKTI
ncbi:MAG: hypothetical protein IKJ91_09245 [Clostridia bacterium]|nr:hypothetical protein [Clostridia bacterium]